MDNAKSQLIDRLKTANSVLITVSRNPSVDQLAACIGLALIVNKLGKHGSAVFSGDAPSTIEFLKPDETFEKNTDSLRDFIIALDKNKADKLRYKVEDQMVKIFITPYKTSIGEKDLEFSQGDFNVELVIALGVKKQEDLDQAIVAHGRILHDATVACINTTEGSNLGTISWQDPTASSLCELVSNLTDLLGDNLLDEQTSTALLTGIIAETHRFSNEKTTAQTMSVSAKLMAGGANQQLVATNLSEAPSVKDNTTKTTNKPKSTAKKTPADGTLNIKHDEDEDLVITTLPRPSDSDPTETEVNDEVSPDQATGPHTPKLVTEPPVLGGTLTANSVPEQYDPSNDPVATASLGAQGVSPALSDQDRLVVQPPAEVPIPVEPAPPSITVPPLETSLAAQLAEPPQIASVPPVIAPPVVAAPSVTPPVLTPPAQTIYTPPPPTWAAPDTPEVQANADSVASKSKTLNELEEAVHSPHLTNSDLDSARGQVNSVLAESPDSENKADQALNAMPLGSPLHQEQSKAVDNALSEIEQIHKSTGLDPSLFSEPPSKTDDQAPPVPPPIQFPIKPTDNIDDLN